MAAAETVLEIPKVRTSFYRPELDALRFFAFLAVFLTHLPTHSIEFLSRLGIPAVLGSALLRLKEAGAFGVDLFFVLSAYLITELLLREKASTGKLDVKAFYVRRILRIWPLYFVFIAIGLLPWLNPGGVFTWKHVLSFLLLSGNWGIIAWGFPLHTVVMPLWSISVEEQFYLTWPQIVKKLSRESILKAAVVMLAISAIARVLVIVFHATPDRVWVNTFVRLDPMACGIIIACVLRGQLPRFSKLQRVMLFVSGVSLVAIVGGLWNLNMPTVMEPTHVLMGYPAAALGCSMILLSVLGTKLNVPAFLVYLGKISYGLYVFHMLGNWIADKIIFLHSPGLRFLIRIPVAFGLTLALSALSYKFLESPFLRLKERFSHVHSRPV